MGDVGEHGRGAGIHQRLGGIDQRAAGIDDVVEQDAAAVGDVADDVHHFRLAGALAALVDDGQRRVDALGQRPGAHHAADVGRYHHDVAHVVMGLDVAYHHRHREQVVGGDVEEALDLAGMQVERHHPVGAGLGDQVGDQLGRDRRAGGRFAILPGVAEIGQHRGDAARRGAAQRVADDQELHQIVVGRVARRLDDEDVLATDVFLDFDEDLLVGEAPDQAFGQRNLEIGGDRFREGAVGVTGDEFHSRVRGGASAAEPGLTTVG